MGKRVIAFLAILSFAVVGLSGCTVRTYKVTRDRVDQDLTAGNHGYVSGTPAPIDTADRKLTRETNVMEVELGRNDVKFKGPFSRKEKTACKRPVKKAVSKVKAAAPQPAVEEPVKFPCPGATTVESAPTQNFGPATAAEPVVFPEPAKTCAVPAAPVAACPVSAPQQRMEKYTVQKGDTLQKISQKYFGTTKKWTKIYDANKDVLKGPNKIYPGQVINIPVEGMKEPAENLK